VRWALSRGRRPRIAGLVSELPEPLRVAPRFSPGTMPRSLSGSCGCGQEWVEPDGGGCLVPDAGWFAGLFEAVVAVPDAFDGAGAGAFTPWWDAESGDDVQVVSQAVGPVLRGE
jgi:hypothetical protein